jgi:hypothetical protein
MAAAAIGSMCAGGGREVEPGATGMVPGGELHLVAVHVWG